MYRLGLLGSHVILNLPHFQPIKSSNFAAQQISQSKNVAETEKCATYFKIQLTLIMPFPSASSPAINFQTFTFRTLVISTEPGEIG